MFSNVNYDYGMCLLSGETVKLAPSIMEKNALLSFTKQFITVKYAKQKIFCSF